MKTEGYGVIDVNLFPFKVMRFHFQNKVISVCSLLMGDVCILIISQVTNNNEYFQTLDSPWKSTPDNIAKLWLNISDKMTWQSK